MNKSSAKGAVINKRYIRLLTGSAALLLLLSVGSVLLLGRSVSLVFHINDPDILNDTINGFFPKVGEKKSYLGVVDLIDKNTGKTVGFTNECISKYSCDTDHRVDGRGAYTRKGKIQRDCRPHKFHSNSGQSDGKYLSRRYAGNQERFSRNSEQTYRVSSKVGTLCRNTADVQSDNR